MGTKHMNLFFPQWQGAGSKELLDCAREIKGKYIKDEYNFIEIPVDDEDVNEVINNIFGYDKILQQLKYANMLVSEGIRISLLKREPDFLQERIFIIKMVCCY